MRPEGVLLDDAALAAERALIQPATAASAATQIRCTQPPPFDFLRVYTW